MKRIFNTLLLGAVLGAPALSFAVDDCSQPAPQPCCKSIWDGKFKFGGEALYWEAVEGQLAIGNQIVSNEAGDEISNKIIRPHFGAELGFRASVGYEFPCEQKWDVNLTYSYVPFKGNTPYYVSANSPDDNDPNDYILLKTLNYDILSTSVKLEDGPALSSKFYDMQGFWKGDVEGFDLSIARRLPFFDNKFSLRPQLGFRTRWGYQTYRFGGTFFPKDNVGTQLDIPEGSRLDVYLKQRFNNYSGFGSLGMNWEIGCGFAVVGSFGVSCGYTSWKMFQKGVITSGDPDVDFGAVATEHDQFPSIGYGISYFAGLEYSRTICKFDVRARLVWESQTTNQNIVNSIGANLGLQGISAGLQVAF